MRVIRALEDAPRPPRRATLVKRIVGWPGSAIAAAVSGLVRLRLAPGAGRSEEELLLLLLASDPNGLWYPWTPARMEDHLDDKHDQP